MQPGSVDFVITDPPYITRYADRSGRSVANDDNARWLKPAFAQMHRLLKSAAFCISFYGWNKADLFIDAWRSAGLSHWSGTRFSQAISLIHPVSALPARAGLFAGKRRRAAARAADSGRDRISLHREQAASDAEADRSPQAADRGFLPAARHRARPLRRFRFSLVAARQLGRQCIGIEIDEQHHRTATARLELAKGIAA